MSPAVPIEPPFVLISCTRPIIFPQRLGLLELRGFAMPPDGQMRLLQMLLVRACVAWFWQVPYCQPFKRWGKVLHDQFLLPPLYSNGSDPGFAGLKPGWLWL